MTIGAKLAAARRNLGLTQDRLAEKMDVTFQTISAWERGESLPDLRKLKQLEAVLGITPNEMLAEDDGDWKLRISDRQPLLDRAIEFASVKHSGSLRKGSTIPYITHVIEAMEIVSEITDDEEVRAAAVLHDTLEDTDTTREELEKNFGKRVADLVAGESENKREDQPAEETWATRKQETIRHLMNADTETRIIALGDKLSNIRAMHRDYQKIGEELWKKFNQPNPIMQGWYYGSVANAFGQDEFLRETPAYREYIRLAQELFDREYEYDENGNPVLSENSESSENSDNPEKPEPESGLTIQLIPLSQARRIEDRESIPMLIVDDATSNEEARLQIMAATVDALLRTPDTGFRGVHLQITNDPEGDDVTWERTEDGYAIHLCAEDPENWCQAAYQLGYSMTHCLIDYYGKEDRKGIRWAEELISEAAALEVLYRLAHHWAETTFGDEDPDYADSIRDYLEANMNDEGTSALLRCRDRDELDAINGRNDFADRIDESHDLFRSIQDQDLERLIRIRWYGADDLLMHTHFWRDRAEGSRAVDYLCRLQERIPGCDVPAGISQVVFLEDSRPTEEQTEVYRGMIRALRALPMEHIVFNFMGNNEKNPEKLGLVFLQMYRKKDGDLHAEIRRITPKGPEMYAIETDDAYVADFLSEIIVTNEIPGLEEWERMDIEENGD